MAELKDRSARNIEPGKTLRDGSVKGLMLIGGARKGEGKWNLRYQLNGRRRDMGFGPFPAVGVAAARLAGMQARALIAQGIDPIDERSANKKASQPVPTFRELAQEVITEAQARTANTKVAYQIERHLGPAYCKLLLDRPINEITTVDVVAVLRPVWRTKPEVARKLYPAIRRVFEAGRIQLRDKHDITIANPATWDDLRAMGFEAPQQLSRGRHPSLPYQQMSEFMTALRKRDAVAAQMLEFIILTNIRTGAARASTFDQFDLEAGVWTVPLVSLKDKKTRKEVFRVPLSPRAVEIVRNMEAFRLCKFVFPSPTGKMFTDMATGNLLKRMNSGEVKWIDPTDGRPIVGHGFRATFKTWCEETAHFPHSIVEEAMGHVVGSSVERAYRRTDLLEQRRALMIAWQNYCEPKAGNVVDSKKIGGLTNLEE